MSFGENLRRERELRGIELRDIADATKISMRFLQALEQDRPEILPGGIFPQAFVRQYARHVGLDAEKTVAEFLYANRGVVVDKGPNPGQVRGSSHRGLLVFALLVIWALIYSWRSRPETPAPTVDPGAGAAAPVAFPSQSVYPPPTGATPPPATTNALVLTVTARRSCWVKVLVDGVAVLNRTLEEGDEQTFEGRSEIAMTLGNAGGVTFTVNGRPGIPLGAEGEVRSVVISRENWMTRVADPGRGAPVTAPRARAGGASPSAVAPVGPAPASPQP